MEKEVWIDHRTNGDGDVVHLKPPKHSQGYVGHYINYTEYKRMEQLTHEKYHEGLNDRQNEIDFLTAELHGRGFLRTLWRKLW